MKYREIQRPTPNFTRGAKNTLRGAILHHTAGGWQGAVAHLTTVHSDPRMLASAHLVIAKDGTRYILAEPEKITWHAGGSLWRSKGITRVNAETLGVEFETHAQTEANAMREALTPEQIESFGEYIKPLCDRYNWTCNEFRSHKHVDEAAGGRFKKIDLIDSNFLLCVQELIRIGVPLGALPDNLNPEKVSAPKGNKKGK